MERSPADLMPRTRLTGNFVVWLLASVLFLACALMLEYRRLDARADKVAEDLSHQLELQLASQHMVLESFAHYLSTLSGPEPDLDLARDYATGLKQHYPKVYMLALASRVEPDALESFMQRMQEGNGRGFSIHPQGESGVRATAPYYPVVLLEPELPEARALLGMDMSYDSSALSGLLGRDDLDAGLSRPIALAENRGYLLFHAVEPGFEHGKSARLGGHRNYALLVVRAATLVPGWALDMPGLSVRLRHPDETLGDRGLLFEHPGESPSLLPLPVFKRTAMLSDETQPLLLDIRYRPPWQALDLWLIGGLFVGGVLLMSQGGWVLLRVSRARQRYMEQQQTLYEKAHYDHLTGLPNTNLLIDRLEQAIRSAQRTASRVAVFFLDLDDFKRVNDLWGHDVGDQLLIQVGVRLRESMRGEDTVARIHGDEFVILIPILEGESQLDNVRDKLELLFTRPFRVGDIELTQCGSIGLAVYPDDADDAEGLLGLADRQMYLHKQAKGRDDISTAVGS